MRQLTGFGIVVKGVQLDLKEAQAELGQSYQMFDSLSVKHFWSDGDVAFLCLTPYLQTGFKWSHTGAKNLPSAVLLTLPETRLQILHSAHHFVPFSLVAENVWRLYSKQLTALYFRTPWWDSFWSAELMICKMFCSCAFTFPQLPASHSPCLCTFCCCICVFANVTFRGNRFVFYLQSHHICLSLSHCLSI